MFSDTTLLEQHFCQFERGIGICRNSAAQANATSTVCSDDALEAGIRVGRQPYPRSRNS